MALMRRMVLALGVLGPAPFLAADFHGAAITPRYSQIRDPVSVLTQRGAVQGGGLIGMYIAAAVLQLEFGATVSAAFAGRDLRLVLPRGTSWPMPPWQRRLRRSF